MDKGSNGPGKRQADERLSGQELCAGAPSGGGQAKCSDVQKVA